MRHAEMEEVMSRDAVLRNAVEALEQLKVDPEKMKWWDLRDPEGEEPPGTFYQDPTLLAPEQYRSDVPSDHVGYLWPITEFKRLFCDWPRLNTSSRS